MINSFTIEDVVEVDTAVRESNAYLKKINLKEVVSTE